MPPGEASLSSFQPSFLAGVIRLEVSPRPLYTTGGVISVGVGIHSGPQCATSRTETTPQEDPYQDLYHYISSHCSLDSYLLAFDI